MKLARNRQSACVFAACGTIVAAAIGCSPQPADPAGQTSTSTAISSAAAPPATVSQFDARWMGLNPDQPQGWQEVNRRITAEFQQFNLRPADESQLPYGCNGCAPWTVSLTAYAPGKLDPTAARTGRSVTVNAAGDGFLREDEAKRQATLSWPYAEDAWATVQGRTSTTIELDRILALAHALRPAERTPIRLPVILPNVPAEMPLAELSIDQGEYGTRLEFAHCGMTAESGIEPCMVESDRMGVQIWPRDDVRGHMQVDGAVPMKIGGRDGLYHDGVNQGGEEAAVQVQPGMLVVFELGSPGPPEPMAKLKDILATVAWAPDPGNAATWPAVSDWAK